jgi:hypothetical protein
MSKDWQEIADNQNDLTDEELAEAINELLGLPEEEFRRVPADVIEALGIDREERLEEYITPTVH